MYDRAPRITDLACSPTPRNVGPPTYRIPDGRDKRVNVVPFLSTQSKFPKQRQPPCEVYYDLPGAIGPAIGGSTPRNKSARFVHQVSDTPCPGDYDPKIPGKCERNIPCGVRPKKLYVCPVPYSVKGSAPSMPMDSLGYNLTRNESLIKILPKKRDTSLGPAFYHVPCHTFSKDKGCKWSGRTGKRSFYDIDLGPGPAAYDVQFPKCRKNASEEEFREMARRFTFLPRYIDSQQMKCIKEDLPGPANYHITDHNMCELCSSIKPRPFICASKRFTQVVSENPGPAEYTLQNVKYAVSKKKVPFSVEAERFAKRQLSDSPGPAYYNIRSPLIEKLLKKKNPYALIEPPFNNTAERNTLALSPDVALTPSPADYYRDVQGHCKILVSSVFKSKTARFKRICTKNELSPATYNIDEPFNNNTKKVSHQAFEISFNATAKRKGLITETDSPGPADYCSQGNLSSKGHLIPTSTRFPEIPEGPGPGTYHIHPYYKHSTYKASKTFNLHIKESILKKKLRRSPNETYNKWASTLKKKKKLRWFLYN